MNVHSAGCSCHRVQWGIWSLMTPDLSMLNTVFKCVADADNPPACSVSVLVNVGVAGSFWQCDWSWLYKVCSEVTLLISLLGFAQLAAALAFHLVKHPQSPFKVNPGRVLATRTELIFTRDPMQINSGIWHSVSFDIFSLSFWGLAASHGPLRVHRLVMTTLDEFSDLLTWAWGYPSSVTVSPSLSAEVEVRTIPLRAAAVDGCALKDENTGQRKNRLSQSVERINEVDHMISYEAGICFASQGKCFTYITTHTWSCH